MGRLRDTYLPESLPYHVVVPSLPGYGFSSQPPLDSDFRLEDVARILNRLMVSLGFGTGYVAQGYVLSDKTWLVKTAVISFKIWIPATTSN